MGLARAAAVAGLLFALLLLAVSQDLAAQAPAGGALDQVALDYQLASRAWIARVLEVTTNLFFWLALLEFVIAGLMYMIAHRKRARRPRDASS